MSMNSFAGSEQDIVKQNSEQTTSPIMSVSPSNGDFDRKGITDGDLIELLISENNRLKEILRVKEQRIHELEKILEQNEPRANKNSEELTSLTRGVSEITDDDIPQRSARRRNDDTKKENSLLFEQNLPQSFNSHDINHKKRESVVSITSNGPINVDEGVLLSPDLKTELSAAKDLSISPRKWNTLDNEKLEKLPQDREKNSKHISSNLLSENTLSEKESIDANIESQTLNPSDSSILSHKSSISSYKPRIKLPIPRQLTDFKAADDSNTTRSSMQKRNSSLDSSLTDNSNEVGSLTGDNFPISEDETLLSTLQSSPERKKVLSEKPQINKVNNRYSMTSQKVRSSSISSSSMSILQDKREIKNITEIPPNAVNSSLNIVLTSTNGSSFHLLKSHADEEEVTLFIQPEDFHTIRIRVVSTITVNSRRTDDPNCTFSIYDKASKKEMWKIRKTLSQIVEFDAEIRPVIEFFGLPPIPEKSVFGSNTPMKVDARMKALQEYFDTIFAMPHIPQMILYRICRYISLDFVNPLDDFKSGAKKEGFLIRRYKGLGTSWKVRWCSIDGPALEIYDSPAGSLLEQIKLSGAQIGRQSSDIVAEDRGYRHAFLILESSKSSKLSGSYPKHFFCAESDSERDEWISAMVEYTENDPFSKNEQFAHSSPTNEVPNDYDNSQIDKAEKSKSDSRLHYIPMELNSSLDNQIPEDSPITWSPETGAQKESKKYKMRSLFPFRNRAYQTEEASFDTSANSITEQSFAEQSMQSYLDQMNLSDEPARSIFGREVEVAFNLSNHELNGVLVPSICFRCIDFLERNGAIYEEGIFRLSGSASTIRQLKEKFNQSFDVDLFESPLRPDIHTVSGLLKTYLRELPHPIFGKKTYQYLQVLVSENSSKLPQSKISLMIRDHLRSPNSIDEISYNFCIAIFGLLRSVVNQSSINKMSLRNICIVFVPTLNISTDILNLCLVDYDCIFGDSVPMTDNKREVLDLQIPTF